MHIKPGWKPGDVKMQYTNFELLQDAMDKHAKKLTIKLSLDDLNEQRVLGLSELIGAFAGKKALNFVVTGLLDENPVSLDMSSKKSTVMINKELLDQLDAQRYSYNVT